MLIGATFRDVHNMRLKGSILGPFWNPNKLKLWTLVTFLNSFHWFHISIASHNHCKYQYFQQYVECGPQRPNFRTTSGIKISKNSGLWSFLHWFCISLSLHVNLRYRKVSNIRRTSLRCSWSIACRRYSNYIFILNLTPGFNGSGTGNCKTRRETFMFWDWVPLY